MRSIKLCLTACLLLTAVSAANGQTAAAKKSPAGTAAAAAESQTAIATPAYAEVLYRQVEIESELESMLLEFTDEYPKVRSLRHNLDLLKKQAETLRAVKQGTANRLTLALGKMMVRKSELDTELWTLRQTLADGHPDVKRAVRKIEIYDRAIREILG